MKYNSHPGWLSLSTFPLFHFPLDESPGGGKGRKGGQLNGKRFHVPRIVVVAFDGCTLAAKTLG